MLRLPAAAVAKSLQLCLTLCDPIDGSPPGSPVPGILQARTLEWVAISFSNAWKSKVKVKSLSCVRLFVTPWTAAHQAPPSMGFSRQEYWSGVPLPSPWDFLEGYKWAFLWIQKPFICPYFSSFAGFKTLLPYPLLTFWLSWLCTFSCPFPFHFLFSFHSPSLPSPPFSPPKGEVQLMFNFQLFFLHLYPSFQSKFVLS